MGILDRYIIRKFFGWLGGILGMLTLIVMIVDVQSKTPRIQDSPYSVGYFLLHFYPYWMLYLIITFLSIAVFLSIIIFTSQMANNTEIVAIISGGASFHRFARPYIYIALTLMTFTLTANHFLLPWANVKKNELIIYIFSQQERQKYFSTQSIATQISANEYIFVNQYDPTQKRGTGYQYQKFDAKGKLTHQIISDSVRWDNKAKNFKLRQFLEKKINPNNTEVLANGDLRVQDFQLSPEELFPNDLQAENKTTLELLDFIQHEKNKGNTSINNYLNELHARTAMPISIFILSILALALSSQKRRGGIGLNITIGIATAFAFIFSFEIFKLLSINQVLPPVLAVWLPNLIFGGLSAHLYRKRANE